MFFRLNEKYPSCLGKDIFIADNARVIGNVELHNFSSVWFNATIRGDNDKIIIGEKSNVQDGCVLHTDPGIPLIVESEVTIGHLAMLHGCHIGRSCLIGIQSTILNGARISPFSIVGANTLVPEGKEYPENVLIIGSPGKVVRELTEKEVGLLKKAHLAYTKKIESYKSLQVYYPNDKTIQQ
ncbi:MAG: gamma carbonic anhydrase family protein [Pseudomonadota bacterium]